jgi:hypothetical protein
MGATVDNILPIFFYYQFFADTIRLPPPQFNELILLKLRDALSSSVLAVYLITRQTLVNTVVIGSP